MDHSSFKPVFSSKGTSVSRSLFSKVDIERFLVTSGLVILFITGIFVLNRPL